MSGTVAAMVQICEEDARWASQFMEEVTRLDIPFAMHFDRCSDGLKDRIRRHPLCVGSVTQDDPSLEFTERHKQAVFDLLSTQQRWQWLLQWDIDEIWERDAPEKIAKLAKRKEEDNLLVQWVNCWGDRAHIRVDTVFAAAPRLKFYNVGGNRRWWFDHAITYGCKLNDDKTGMRSKESVKSAHSGIVCLHTGLMTRELREHHKTRWDRIYSAAVGANPYHFWEYCLMEDEYPPTVIPNPHRSDF